MPFPGGRHVATQQFATVTVKEEFQHTETVTQGTLTFRGLRPSPESDDAPIICK